ncbi:MAG TPA: response regulator [Anaerolineae bacterium]|jgi:CheY-like chemotaxis protein|nr:response regulator [Anaerolineae bacterium]
MTKILIVDDDKATATLLRTLFEIEGLEGAVCSSAEQVLADVRSEHPDLLLMDAHLAEVDSLGILRDLKADAVIGRIPVVVVSGMDRSDEFLPAGAAAFVLKPFKPADLMSVIRRYLP